jgi:hypothetical protein
VWGSYATDILDRPGILIPDTDEDLTWHAFLGHSLDQQGFRAAEFAGVDRLTKPAPRFVPLRQRDLGVRELASLWRIDGIREHLLTGTKGVPLAATLDVLRGSGGPVGESFAEALEWFPWRKFHKIVRALLQNSAVLEPYSFSFRDWLRAECSALGTGEFPPPDFRRAVGMDGVEVSLERALRIRLERTFYLVGPALAAYMLCDWQLWLWNQGATAVFANFKLDSFHEAFIDRYGIGIVPSDEEGFARWWLEVYPELPPRLANECIWLGMESGLVG